LPFGPGLLTVDPPLSYRRAFSLSLGPPPSCCRHDTPDQAEFFFLVGWRLFFAFIFFSSRLRMYSYSFPLLLGIGEISFLFICLHSTNFFLPPFFLFRQSSLFYPTRSLFFPAGRTFPSPRPTTLPTAESPPSLRAEPPPFSVSPPFPPRRVAFPFVQDDEIFLPLFPTRSGVFSSLFPHSPPFGAAFPFDPLQEFFSCDFLPKVWDVSAANSTRQTFFLAPLFSPRSLFFRNRALLSHFSFSSPIFPFRGQQDAFFFSSIDFSLACSSDSALNPPPFFTQASPPPPGRI